MLLRYVFFQSLFVKAVLGVCPQITDLVITPMCFVQVLEAAVIAIPHSKWTERPLLVVVQDPKAKLTKEDMLRFLQVCCHYLIRVGKNAHGLRLIT